MSRILLVDDERRFAEVLALSLREEGFEVETRGDPHDALELVNRESWDVVVTDLRMPKMDGLELIDCIRRASPDTACVVVTAFATVETAMEALRKGVRDYLLKPFRVEQLLFVLRRIEEERHLRRENLLLRAQQGLVELPPFVGSHAVVEELLAMADRVAATNASVLLRGESGTGKGILARRLHDRSARRDGPFVTIDCAVITPSLLESELFGHEKGAFTGATMQRLGKFELARGGTVLLDEVGDMPAALQAKLLRVLQERRYERVGGSRSLEADVRILAATNVDLEGACREGRFREDLYYRLNVVTLDLPPLRRHLSDLPELIRHMLEVRARSELQVDGKAVEAMMAYPWPGNVRELENVIERALVLCEGGPISTVHLPFSSEGPQGRVLTVEGLAIPGEGFSLEDFEDELVRRVYEESGKVKTRTARRLGLTRRQLDSRLARRKDEP